MATILIAIIVLDVGQTKGGSHMIYAKMDPGIMDLISLSERLRVF